MSPLKMSSKGFYISHCEREEGRHYQPNFCDVTRMTVASCDCYISISLVNSWPGEHEALTTRAGQKCWENRCNKTKLKNIKKKNHANDVHWYFKRSSGHKVFYLLYYIYFFKGPCDESQVHGNVSLGHPCSAQRAHEESSRILVASSCSQTSHL